MKILISESQYKKIISEQPDSRFGPERFMDYKDQMNLASGNYKDMSDNAWDNANKKQTEYNRGEGGKLTFQILLSELPIIGPYLGAGILVYNFQSDYRKAQTSEDKQNVVLGYLAGIAIGVGVGYLCTSVGELGSAGMSSLSQKLKTGQPLTELEKAATNEMVAVAPRIKAMVQEAPKKLSPYADVIKQYRPQYIQKYGSNKYDELIGSVISNKITKEQFIKGLKFGVEKPNVSFVSQFGVKFTTAEAAAINKITSLIDKIPFAIKDGIRIFTNKINGPTLKITTKAKPEGFVNLKITFMSTKEIKRLYPAYEYLTKAKGFMASENEIVLHTEYVYGLPKGDLDRILFHEIGHIKDPSLVKSPMLNKIYEPGHEFQSQKWYDNYYNHQFERTAEMSAHFNTFSTKVQNSVKLMGKERILNAMDSIIGFAKGSGTLSEDATWLLEIYEGSDVSEMMKMLSTSNPKGYRQYWNKLAQQSNYLKSQVKIMK